MKTCNRSKKYALSAALVLALMTAAVVWGVGGETSDAATLVTSAADDGSPGTLRYELNNATDGTTVEFDPSVTTISLIGGISIPASNVTIDGGAAGVTLTTTGTGFGLLNNNIWDTTSILTLRNLTLENALVWSVGGGVYSSANIVLENCTFREDKSTGHGGAIAADGNVTMTNCTFTGNSATIIGGAVLASGTVTMTNCTFTDNTSGESAGAVFAGGGATLTDCTFTHNTTSLYGGAVYSSTDITMTNCTFTENAVYDDEDSLGGGLYAYEDVFMTDCTFTENKAANFGYGFGGGVYAFGNVTITSVSTGCKFEDNLAGADGGGIYAAGNVTLTGLPGSTFAGNAAGADGGGIYAGGDVSLTTGGCAFTGNEAFGNDDSSGGGIYAAGKVTLTGSAGSTFTGNLVKYRGGGICAYNGVELRSCTFTNNRAEGSEATGGGGGVYCNDGNATLTSTNFNGNNADYGGGMCMNSDALTFSIFRCQFIDNVSKYDGGAVYSNSYIEMTDSTLEGNKANGMWNSSGGGIYVLGALTVGTTTFRGNEANEDGGAVLAYFVNADHCTFCGNTAPNGSGGAVCSWGSSSMLSCALYSNRSSNGGSALMVYGDLAMINCTVSDNENSTAVMDHSAAVDFFGEGYFFHCTVTGNIHGGICASDEGSGAHLYNCIVMDNTWSNMNGAGTVDISFGNLVEHESIPGSSPAVGVDSWQVFGTNGFEPSLGTHQVLGNGIAAGTAAEITAADLAGTALDPSFQADILVALARDQVWMARTSGGPVTYGAVETPLNTLVSMAVTTQPDKTNYLMLEYLDMTGTELTLRYSDTSVTSLPYNTPGMITDDSFVDMGMVGPYTVNFIYLGITSSPGAVINVTGPSGTVTYLFVDPSSAYPTQSITLTADVAATSSTSAAPTGTVEFFEGTTHLGTAALVSGTAELLIPGGLPAGTYDFSAVYGGNTWFNGSTDDVYDYAVDLVLSDTYLSASPLAPAPGAPITLSVSVGPGGTPCPTGSVDFFEGTTYLGTATLAADGTASFIIPGLSAGTYDFSAVYVGDGVFDASRGYIYDYVVAAGSSSSSSPSLIINGGNVVKTYGDPNFFLTTKSGPPGVVMWYSSNPELVSVNPTTGEVTIKGATNDTIVTITAKKSSATASIVVTVNKKPITVTADDKEKRAGEADPALTYSMSPAPLAKDTLSGSLRHNGSEPGKYDIVDDGSFGADPNYAVTFVKGTMTITPDNDFPWWILILIILVVCVIIIIVALRRKNQKG